MSKLNIKRLIICILILFLGLSFLYMMQGKAELKQSKNKLQTYQNDKKIVCNSSKPETLSNQAQPEKGFKEFLNRGFVIINTDDYQKKGNKYLEQNVYQTLALAYNPLGGEKTKLLNTDMKYNVDGENVTGFGTITVEQHASQDGQEGTEKKSDTIKAKKTSTVMVKMKNVNGKYIVDSLKMGEVKKEGNQDATIK